MLLTSLLPYLLVIIPILASLLSHKSSTKTHKKLPPGPWPLPIIGNLLKLGYQPHKSLKDLATIHGPIMSLKLGQITTIVISSPTIAREALQQQDLAFSGRFVPNAIHAHDQNRYSVMWLPVADRWKSLRKVFKSLVSATTKLDSTQHLRRKKVCELMAYVEKCRRKGETVDIGQAAFVTSLNLLSNAIFSVDLADPSKDSSREFRDLVSNSSKEAGTPNLVDYFPLLDKIDPQGIRHRLSIYIGRMLKIFSKLIDERLELRKSVMINNEDDMLDSLLNLSEGNNDEIDRTHIERIFVDIFSAGTDTTSNTIEWAMAEMLDNPAILKQAQAELEQIVGKGKPIEESDITHLPYLRAIVNETLRKHPPAPLILRKVETNVEICGYAIPKDAQVLINVWAISHDPNLWENPTLFNPERFLNSQIDVRGQDFEFIPFGAGRRICPGLALAMRVVPVVVGSLLNSFDWKIEGGTTPVELDMEEKFGLSLQKAQPLRIVPIY